MTYFVCDFQSKLSPGPVLSQSHRRDGAKPFDYVAVISGTQLVIGCSAGVPNFYSHIEDEWNIVDYTVIGTY